MESLKNKKNRKYLIEEIRRQTIKLDKENCHIEYTWIKAHAGHQGNEKADRLAKDAARDGDKCYNKIPKSDTKLQDQGHDEYSITEPVVYSTLL